MFDKNFVRKQFYNSCLIRTLLENNFCSKRNFAFTIELSLFDKNFSCKKIYVGTGFCVWKEFCVKNLKHGFVRKVILFEKGFC